jgi:predicted transcriptional regulator
MKTSPFSLRIDTKLKARLEREAKRGRTTATGIVEAAIASYLDGVEGLRKALGDAIAEADKGVFISEEAMNAWMDAWGSGKELPFPEPDVFPAGAASPAKKRNKAA